MIHDIVKMRYSRAGYLPDYPYHLISDREMFDAFLDSSEDCFFAVTYPCTVPELRPAYIELKSAIQYHINKYLDSGCDEDKLPPDWVYSYMLGSCVGPNSPELDRHDMLVLLHMDNLDDILSPVVLGRCYEISYEWVSKLPISKSDHRPPTMFGEPHVIKSLRLSSVDVMR